MTSKRKLKVWASGGEDRPAHRPSPSQVLYTGPNPDGTRKTCQRCCHWMASDNQCWLMDGDVVVPAEAICNYFIYGRPNPGGNGEQTRRPDMVPVVPEMAGFDHVAGGTSCDRCRHFTPSGGASVARVARGAKQALGGLYASPGQCSAVEDPDTQADFAVDALGRCAHWQELV